MVVGPGAVGLRAGAADVEIGSGGLFQIGAEILAARMRLLPGDGGYVLTLRDVTADLATHAKREALLAEVLDRIRRPAANLRALLAVLPEGEPTPAAMDTALRAEADNLTRAVTDLALRQEEGRAEAIPRSPLRVADLADSLRQRLRRLPCN